MSNYSFKVLKKTSLHPLVVRVWKIILIIFSFIVALLFLPWQQTVQGVGVLSALIPQERDYDILAPIDGFINKYDVNESQKVVAGQRLLSMSDLDKNYLDKLNRQRKSVQQRLENAQMQVSQLQERRGFIQTEFKAGMKIFAQKKQQFEKKIETLKYKAQANDKNYEIEAANYERIKLLYQEGIESKRDFEKIERTHIQAKADLKKVHMDIEIQELGLKILLQQITQYKAKNKNTLNILANQIVGEKSNVERLKQELQNLELARARYKSAGISAKSDGQVVRILQNDTNRYISKNTPLLHFAPKVMQRAIRLKVSDFNMPLIKEGLKVRIKFYGWPALQISGWPQIKYGTFGGIVKRVEALTHEKGFYYAYVVEDPLEPWPKGDVLRQGTQAVAWVRLGTVSIWYELWRLMNALPPKMISEQQNIDLIEGL